MIPEIPADLLAKKIVYSTLSELFAQRKAIFDLKMNVDQRGSFTELVHTLNCGQVSINISKPGHYYGEIFAQYQMGTVYCCQRSWLIQLLQGR